MSVIPIAIEIAKLAILAIILFYVCEVLTMPQSPKLACQLLIILIAILASIQIVVAGTVPMRRDMSLSPTPSIIAPERR